MVEVSSSNFSGVTLKDQSASNIDEPMDLILLSLKEKVFVKCRFGRELRGKLVGYDEHLNLMLSDVEERITTTDIDPLTKLEQVKVSFTQSSWICRFKRRITHLSS